MTRKITTRNCKGCNKPFTLKKGNNLSRLYCSDECKGKRPCVKCGRPTPRNHSSDKCLLCREKLHIDMDRPLNHRPRKYIGDIETGEWKVVFLQS